MAELDLIDAAVAAAEVGIPIDRLWQLSLRGKFIEMYRVDHGKYRVSRREFDAWLDTRRASSVAARATLIRERVKAGDY